ncbi:MAG: hypothetical protein MUE87_00155 [Methanothrix sp.]|nr:hypothetical protein [Methanothrix sp.]
MVTNISTFRACQRQLRALEREITSPGAGWELAKGSSSPAEAALPARRLARPPEDNIRPAGKWTGGMNGPVEV